MISEFHRLENLTSVARLGFWEYNLTQNTFYGNPTVFELFGMEDTGIGIAAEDLESLFEPFKQLEAGRLKPGSTGLGLSICRAYVHLMQDSIDARSTLGEGSTFFFDLYCPEAEMQRPPPERQSSQKQGAEKSPLPSASWRSEFLSILEDFEPEKVEEKLEYVRVSHPEFYAKANLLCERYQYADLASWIQAP